MIEEPFGRQPEPVTITLSGHPLDVEYWKSIMIRMLNYHYDEVHDVAPDAFKIFPRAVND